MLKIKDREYKGENNITTSYKLNNDKLRAGPTFAVNGGQITGIDDEIDNLVEEFVLSQNYPNPFNPSTNISYQLPENGYVVLKVFNSLGQEVSILVNEYKQPGLYTVEFRAENLPTGVYLYTIKVNNFLSSKKMLLVKT